MYCTCCGHEADPDCATCANCGARYSRQPAGMAAGLAIMLIGLSLIQLGQTGAALAIITAGFVLFLLTARRRWLPFGQGSAMRGLMRRLAG
ncbi:hypothetical protein [Paracoccus sp. NSM]|uniref:hypothetical protein n=1 Tax=Paracoccus sp. NSM TaxID=3457784 RepID=UPI004036F611